MDHSLALDTFSSSICLELEGLESEEVEAGVTAAGRSSSGHLLI